MRTKFRQYQFQKANHRLSEYSREHGNHLLKWVRMTASSKLMRITTIIIGTTTALALSTTLSATRPAELPSQITAEAVSTTDTLGWG